MLSSLPLALCPTAKSHSDRLITAKDHASIQIRVADVDANGKAIKESATTIAICGRIRAQGDSDDSINRIATKEGCESQTIKGRSPRSDERFSVEECLVVFSLNANSNAFRTTLRYGHQEEASS